RYELTDPALRALAVIVRGADTDDRDLTPESSGLYAAATGFQATSKDDFDNIARQFPMYDAFYNYCQQQIVAVPKTPRVLFVCLPGAAKSVVAAAHFRMLAAQRGLAVEAAAAGTAPDPELGPLAVKGLVADGLEPAPKRPRPATTIRPTFGVPRGDVRLRRHAGNWPAGRKLGRAEYQRRLRRSAEADRRQGRAARCRDGGTLTWH